MPVLLPGRRTNCLTEDPDSLDKPCNFFKLQEVQAEEGSKDDEFVLKTVEGEFILKAGSEESKRQWVRSIYLLRKKTLASRKQRGGDSDLQTATKSTKSPNKTARTAKSKAITSEGIRKEVMPVDFELLRRVELINYVRFLDAAAVTHSLLSGEVHLLKRSSLFSTLRPRYLLLFSSKSLYPEKFVSESFLLNKQLPPWLEVNSLYSVDLGSLKKARLFHVS